MFENLLNRVLVGLLRWWWKVIILLVLFVNFPLIYEWVDKYVELASEELIGIVDEKTTILADYAVANTPIEDFLRPELFVSETAKRFFLESGSIRYDPQYEKESTTVVLTEPLEKSNEDLSFVPSFSSEDFRRAYEKHWTKEAKKKLWSKMSMAGYQRSTYDNYLRYIDEYIEAVTYEFLSNPTVYPPPGFTLDHGGLEGNFALSDLAKRGNNMFGIKARFRTGVSRDIKSNPSLWRDHHFQPGVYANGVMRNADEHAHYRFNTYPDKRASIRAYCVTLTNWRYGNLFTEIKIGDRNKHSLDDVIRMTPYREGVLDRDTWEKWGKVADQLEEEYFSYWDRNKNGFLDSNERQPRSKYDFFDGVTEVPYYYAYAFGLKIRGYFTSHSAHESIVARYAPELDDIALELMSAAQKRAYYNY